MLISKTLYNIFLSFKVKKNQENSRILPCRVQLLLNKKQIAVSGHLAKQNNDKCLEIVMISVVIICLLNKNALLAALSK